MKKVITILSLIAFVSCSPKITGLYKHEICGNSPDCFMYDFCKDGRFTYWYSQDILGSSTLTGNWEKKKNIIYLIPDKYLFQTETKVVCKKKQPVDSTEIKIRLLPQYFKSKRDTTFLTWLVKLDNSDSIYETNENGVLNLSYRPIHKITVRDYSLKFGSQPMIQLSDSIFTVDNASNDISIFIADNDSKPMILGVNREMRIKGKKLISVQPDSLKNSRPDKYIRVTRKCGNIKNE